MIDILGAGPSLGLYGFEDTRPVIYTNSLIMLNSFVENRNSIFIAHEKRLNSSKFRERLGQLPKSKRIVLAGDLEKDLVDFPRSFGSFYKEIKNHSFAKYLFRKNSEKAELLRNVVLDFAIPYAVSLDYKKINLYGCDFSYNNHQKPEYYVRNIGKYEHTEKTHIDWQTNSLSKFENTRTILEKKEIILCRHL